MPRGTTGRRVPISCENCRRRKIACSGGKAPCQTCRKRGHAASCYFLRDLKTQPHTAYPMLETDQSSLLSRISTLERLLQENIDSTRRHLSMRTSGHDEATVFHISSENPQNHTYIQSGQLVYSQSGHVRYMVVDNAFREWTQEDVNVTRDHTSLECTEFPFSPRVASTTAQILELLPPLSYCDELQSVFINVFSPLFHILHDPTFEEEYAAFRRNPNEVSTSFLAMIFVILAVAVTALDEDHHILSDLGRESNANANARTIAARFRSAAMQTLSADQFLWRHNLRTLQTLVLLIYALNHAQRPAWALLGTTLNIAIAIGCHIDPSRYDVSIVEGEERRRCWAALTMLHTIQDTCMGNLSPMNIQADIRPPADLDDDELSNMQSQGGNQSQRALDAPSKMTYIIYKFKLYRLASEICTLSASSSWEKSSALVLDRKVATEESIQTERFQNLEALPLYHQAHHYILSSYTNHLYVILHRPCLSVLTSSPSSSFPSDDSHLFSIRRLHQACSAILDNHEILHGTQSFRSYRWYTYGLGSFHAFLAATTMATIIGIVPLRMEIDVSSVLQKLRECLRRFEEVSERSNVCAKAAIILRRFLIHQPQHVQHQSTLARHQNPSTQGNSSYGQGLERQDQSSEPTEMTWAATNSLDQTSVNFSNNDDLCVDVWSPNLDLQSLFFQIPCQQWLSPSTFPWWRWDEGISPTWQRETGPLSPTNVH